jgi:N-acetylmuramoyl-L-alanine amidase
MKICVDAGHYCPPSDTGAVGFLNEEVVAANVATLLVDELRKRGHDVLLTNATDGSSVTASLSQRCRQSNDFGAKLYVSLHCNASETTDSPMGTEVFATSTAGNAYAARIESAIVAKGFKSRGVKNGGSLYVLKNTNAVAVLVEMFFCDSRADCALYKKLGAAAMASTIADAIVPQVAVRQTLLQDASKYDAALPHQQEAWKWLQSQLSNAQLAEFQQRFTPASKAATESTPHDVDWAVDSCKISKYFTVLDATKGEDERRPRAGSVEATNILRLAAELDKLREAWGSGICVSSWNRPGQINVDAGGSKYSQHLHGLAADVYPANGSDIFVFQKWCDSYWQGALGYGAAKGFVHLDLRDGGKGVRWVY